MVTMKDVAKAAGVSQSSVSYAYSGLGRISDTQRAQILSVAAQLGYTGPNIAGSSLRLGRIGTVGVLVPGSLSSAVEDPSTTLLLKGIVEVGEMSDVALTLLPVPAQPAGHQQPIKSAALRGLVDGVVMHCLPNHHPVVDALISRGVPAVAIDSPRLPNVPYVTIDHRRAGTEQMNHVLALGHRRIGIISDHLSATPQPGCRPFAEVSGVSEKYLEERLAGYRDAIEAVGGRDVHVSLIEARDIDSASGMVAATELLSMASPTAIVTTSDVHAVAALKVLRQHQLSVPGDVSVIGFDDAPIAELMDLTTIRQPLIEKGRAAATMLLDVIAGQPRRRTVKQHELVVRATTGPAPTR